MYQFSKREKVLLCCLTALCGIAGPGSVLLMPSLEKRQVLEMKLEAALEEQKVMSEAAEQADFWKQERETGERLAEEKLKVCYQLADTESIGEELVILMEECGLKVREMSVSVEPVENSGGDQGQQKESLTAASDGTGIFCGSIAGEAVGSREAVMNFLDRAAENPAMKIREFFLTDGENGSCTFAFTLNMYMAGHNGEEDR